MNLTRLETVSAEEALANSGTILAACGYEARSSAISKILGDSVKKRIALAFLEYQTDPVRLKNSAVFEEAGFKFEVSSGAKGSVARRVISEVFDEKPLGEVTIDISSMTRVWYAAAIWYLRSRSLSHTSRPAVVNFLYFPGKYKQDMVRGTPNEVVGPVPGFCSLEAPEKPTALVLGIGFDEERARGLQELLEPKKTVFLKAGGNFRPLEDIPETWRGPSLAYAWRDAIEYPLQDPLTTYQLTESITSSLSSEHRVVLVSLGPKILGLLFLLVGTQRPDVSVWRVSSGASEPPTNIEAQEYAVVCRTVWN
jgi:hypothetical protein